MFCEQPGVFAKAAADTAMGPGDCLCEFVGDLEVHFREEVRDEGIGIERPQLKRIFRRFYRVPSDDVYARSGTGLGLYVVAALVRNLGGQIAAYSAGHMQGTKISVKLPVAVAGEAA